MQVQGTCEKKFIEVKDLFQSFFNNNEETGANFSVVQNGKVLINLYGGLKNKNDVWNENTLVNTFSLSKGIYAGCVLKLIQDNQLDINKNVSYYWPEFSKSEKKDILVKHILSHQSGLYRFKEKIENADLLDWNKISTILERQSPDHKPGEKTYYHAKTHGFLVGNLIKKITGKSIGNFFKQEFTNKFGLNFHFGIKLIKQNNIADLNEKKKEIFNKDSELNAFNNPKHDVSFYNRPDWREAEVPSMGGHGSALSVAKFYDLLANDYRDNYSAIINRNSLKEVLNETNNKIDLSLNLQIRWSNCGYILRGGWMFGKHRESFGHNGWGGSLGFADPVYNIGISYVTKHINPTMGSDNRAVKLIKKFYDLYENNNKKIL